MSTGLPTIAWANTGRPGVYTLELAETSGAEAIRPVKASQIRSVIKGEFAQRFDARPQNLGGDHQLGTYLQPHDYSWQRSPLRCWSAASGSARSGRLQRRLPTNPLPPRARTGR